ncbi:TetR/AcrR family transcriptional regulator [Archangium lansingense]|uniref:TetR/AcrR family transcriptional regulator n=1 Tax=Archangium lansingense TaxID=2995310 RepID=A0ABT4ALR7_9BACT|nr:TetR/AcrR family transcriptional regulator [Archangium lansinium]MCY1082638.1 TetR/AcrR family transcriptional regulator [Archangium lansinium]
MVTSRKSSARQKAAEAPGLRERNKQEKLERIREAARELFASKGYAETTTREIAERAGVGTGTLFLYARTKEELLMLIFAERVEAVQEERFRTLPRDAPLLEQLVHVFEGFFRLYAKDQELARMFIRELLFLEPRPAGERLHLERTFSARLAGLVAAARERGEVAEHIDLEMAGFNLFALYITTLMGWLSGALGPGETWRPVLERALALQLRGLEQDAVPSGRSKRRRS